MGALARALEAGLGDATVQFPHSEARFNRLPLCERDEDYRSRQQDDDDAAIRVGKMVNLHKTF